MTETQARDIAFEFLGYFKGQSISGMLASDYPKLIRLESALLKASREARIQAINECMEMVRSHRFGEPMAYCIYDLEGKLLSLLQEPKSN